jgi:hypothetical protein
MGQEKGRGLIAGPFKNRGMPRHFMAGLKLFGSDVMVEPGRESQRQHFESQ